MHVNNENWTTEIKPKNGWFDIDFKELWNYRDLIGLFIKRDFVTYYKQTILGPLWFIIQALFTAGLFTIIFGKVANISTDGVPHILFYLAGVINWQYFADCVNKASKTFIDHKAIISKVYFPRLAIPISTVMSNVIQYVIKYALFAIVLIYYAIAKEGVNVSLFVLLTPLLLFQMALLALGIGVWVSALASKYRDLAFAIPFLIQLAMYTTPVVYPASLVPMKYKLLFYLNPMSSIIENFRFLYFGSGTVSLYYTMIGVLITLLIFTTGIVVFSRIEKSVMDSV